MDLAINYFFEQWVPLEKYLNRATYPNSPKARGAFNINRLKRMELLDQETLNQIVLLRKLRNVLIHDIEIPDRESIMKQGHEAHDLLARLTKAPEENAAAVHK